MERMTCNLRDIKANPDDGSMQFSGYGAVFGNVDSWGDVIQPGAFTDTLKSAKDNNQWPSMLLQHGMTADIDVPVGIWLEMKEDAIGLYVEGKLADTEKGKDVYALLKMEPRSAINGLSIGYIPVEWAARSKPEEPRRTLKKVNLMEVSLVTFPANDKARVTNIKSIREAERALRDVGFSQSETKTILADGYKAISHRDDEGDANDLAESIKSLIRKNMLTMKN
jgi:hypothetical protein